MNAPRTVVVTGTSSGIGAAAAALLADGGWRVVGIDRRAGDVPIYVARADKAAEVLGFRTEKTLDEMCASSWQLVSTAEGLT